MWIDTIHLSNGLVKTITHISLKPFGYGLIRVGLPILTALVIMYVWTIVVVRRLMISFEDEEKREDILQRTVEEEKIMLLFWKKNYILWPLQYSVKMPFSFFNFLAWSHILILKMNRPLFFMAIWSFQLTHTKHQNIPSFSVCGMSIYHSHHQMLRRCISHKSHNSHQLEISQNHIASTLLLLYVGYRICFLSKETNHEHYFFHKNPMFTT